MIVAVAIDPDALSVDDPTKAVDVASHARLLDRWRRLGILVHSSTSIAQSELIESVNSLPLRLRKIWQEAFMRFRMMTGPVGWNGLQNVEKTGDLSPLGGIIQVACLCDLRAEYIGLMPSEVSCTSKDANIEVVRFSCADQAQAFAVAESICQSDIQAGEAVNDVWATRFERLSSLSRQVVIVDRYAVSNHHLHDRPECHSGLRRFLTNVDGNIGSRSVKIYASTVGVAKDDLRMSLEHLVTMLKRGGIKYIQLFLVEDSDFQKISHDRYVRFDKSVCDVGVGVDVMSGYVTFRRTQFSLKDFAPDREVVETELFGHKVLQWEWRRP